MPRPRFAADVGLTAFFSLALLIPAAHAEDINSLQTLAKDEFHLLTEDLGAALSLQSLAPAAPLGLTGFDLGVAVTGTVLEHVAVLEKASGGESTARTLPVPTLRLAKGLPLNIDVGAFYAAVPSSNLKLYGGELRWAVFPGNALLPAIAVHGAYAKLDGVTQLALTSKSLDVSISKGFALITPYVGAGKVWTQATPKNIPGLAAEQISQTKLFVGLSLQLGLPSFTVEATRTGGIASYGAKIGLRW